ncbi:sulfatase [Flavicella sediminum]|uniref:sulfatase n=1 Tax=Flavicella sediminum TaxID=2585141 RepID=UPI00111D38D1|nr:sulfatase [Flavicella sediminum]
MKKLRKPICLLILVISTTVFGQAKRPNILFIGIDDLRPELGCYGSPIAKTPNLDALAAQGLLFNKAYCQQAICGPSRASLLTGIRPETSGVYHNYIKFRESNPEVITLPQHFVANGYEAAYCGKIFHHGDLDDELSWSRKPATDNIGYKKPSSPGGYALVENQNIQREHKKVMSAKYGKQAKFGLGTGPAYECADVPDQAYTDGYNTEVAIATMKEMLQNNEKPFFLALGMRKPHLNWVSPKRYWDLYDPKDIPLDVNDSRPYKGAEMGLHPSFELRTRHGIPKKGAIDKELGLKLKHAYLACVSYVDAQIGRMIQAIDDAGIRDNTIIVVWSDHGWHLGDMGIWGKATNYEIATRVPMIIWTPEMLKNKGGTKTEALVELVDIYPSLCELANISKPKHLEGKSFVPLIKNPKKKWKKAAFSQFPTPALREWGAFPLRQGMRETYFGPLVKAVENRIEKQQGAKWNKELFENHVMGYAMRTQQYRLILWKDRRDLEKKPLYVELYDHENDPFEKNNIAEEETKLVKKLTKLFDKEWKGNFHKRVQ